MCAIECTLTAASLVAIIMANPVMSLVEPEAYALKENVYQTFVSQMTWFFLKGITGAETMLKELNEVGKEFGQRINWKKTHFMKDAYKKKECS